MARSRHKKKTANIVLPSAPKPAENLSPAAKKVIERIMKGGPEYLSDNLARVLIDSARLAEEPEFIDLALDGIKAAKATRRWFAKYEKRLEAAHRKSADEHQQVVDEMRINIIDELAAPAFRQEVKQRLDRLQNRFMIKGDPDTLETVLLLGPILGMKETPWGLCGLIIAIYNRSMDKVMAEHEDETVIYGAISEVLKEEGQEKIDPNSLLESPKKLDRITQKLLGKDPGLRERLERHAMDIVNQFEKELWEGKIVLDLFTEEEILLPFQRLKEEYGRPVTEMQQTEESKKHNAEVIAQSIRDIMTPERLLRMRKDVHGITKSKARELRKWIPVLEMEIDWLEEENDSGQNPFILSAFFGQIRSMGKQQKRKR